MKEDFVKEMLLKTKQLTLRSIKVFQSLPKTEESKIIGKQFYGLRLLLVQITEQCVEQGVEQSIFQN